MPGNYAHYRFGQELISHMDPRQQRIIGRFRQLYDMGLHGPDLFYYTDSLLLKTDGKPGKQFHELTGKAFFEQACQGARTQGSEGMTAYLCGLLAHYTLDSTCHPFIHRNTTDKLTHDQIETEFDRYLLNMDGHKPAHLYDCSRHMSLSDGEAALIAPLYPGMSAAQVKSCARNMKRSARLLTMPKGFRRDLSTAVLSRIAPQTAHRIMPLHANRACASLDPSLLRLYEMAASRYDLLLELLFAHLKKGVPLGPDFDAVFGK